jgi:RNA polymerase sigma factor (sigma-70 family)
MRDDAQLLEAYAAKASEPAFTELVARHIDLVYAAALRVVVGDAHLARDITQIVFLDLARKAHSLPRGVFLAGWLHRHTCFVAAKAVRTERRRTAREQIAMEMKALDDNSQVAWEQIAPYLDESLDQLNTADRIAIVLRFLKQQDLRVVGAALGISDDAAQKRVSRALEKLRALLKRRGVLVPATGLPALLAAQAITAAPAGLAVAVTATSLSAAAAAGTTFTFCKIMTLTKLQASLVGSLVIAAAVAPLVIYSGGRTEDVLRDGAFGFPQKEAKVLCDRPDLRFSVWNNADYLFAQAVLWNDPDASLGKTDDNREIGDNSTLMLDVDGDGKITGNVDRDYLLNPWPEMAGVYYQILYGGGGSSTLRKDSQGRGAIRYVKAGVSKPVRVDTYLIPMAEISRKPGEKIRLCFYVRSMKPDFVANSTEYKLASGEHYYSYRISHRMYHEYALTNGHAIDALQVPEGREDPSLSKKKTVPMPKIGDLAPEISAREWINLKGPITLKQLRGKVVLVEFWASWCGPCIEAIPRLNELNEKYAGKGFQMLSFVQEGHKTLDRVLRGNEVKYPIGLESNSLDDYGITGIPQAFIIGRDGKVMWQGHVDSADMEDIISAELKKSG